MIEESLINRFKVAPGQVVSLKDYETGYSQTKELRDIGKDEAKVLANEILTKNIDDLAAAQDLLYADDRFSVLIIFQAMDAAGKDGTIKHVMSGVNPQGCQVFSFKQPSSEELDHNFLWRYMKSLPERGRIGIFNRSYYEDVLVVKVHPDRLGPQLPQGKRNKSFWEDRYEDITAFEKHLVRNGTMVLKFFLHMSKAVQKERFLERIDRPDKNWKFSSADVLERQYWKDYQKAYEDAINATSSPWAPWYIIPADHKWATRTLVADIIVSAIHSLDLSYPKMSDERKAGLATARKMLEDEK